MAPLVPVPSASHLLQQAQGVQWMAPQVPVPPCRFLPPAPGLVDVT